MDTSLDSQDRLDPKHNLPMRQAPKLVSTSRQRARATEKPSEGISPTFFLYVFMQWWKWIVPAGIALAFVAGAGIIHFHVPEYEAKALVLIESNPPYIAFGTKGDQGNGDRYIQTQIELLRSPVVLTPVLSHPEIASLPELIKKSDPLAELEKHLAIRQVGNSDLYELRYVSNSADGASKVVNTVVAEYLAMQTDDAFRRSQRVIDVLEEERLRRSNEVERMRGQVLKLAKEVTGKDPFGGIVAPDNNLAMLPTGGLYQSLTEVEVNREVLKAEIKSLKESSVIEPNQVRSENLLELEIASRTDVRELENRIEVSQQAMDFLKGEKLNWEEDPRFKKALADSVKFKKELAELKELVRTEMLALSESERKAEHEQLILKKEQQLASLNARQEVLTNRYEDEVSQFTSQRKSDGAQSVQLEFARAELAREEGVFELIAARKLALQTELRAPPRVALKQKASVPVIAVEPIPFKLLGVASLAALLCPLALAVARELTVKRITNSDQLVQESRLNVLAEIARFPVRPVANQSKQLSNRMQRQMYIFAESIDSLRTNLILSENFEGSDDRRVIAVCSAASGEGKSSVATSLAVSFGSASQQPVLIIDCDLRAPDVASVLGTPTSPGLAEVLTGKTEIDNAVYRVGKSNTYVLPAGKARVNPHHVVQESQFKQMLEKLQTTFPTIIIDTPPVLSASEALVFAKAADLVVFCSLSDVSRAKQVRLAVDRLQSTGANLVGAVLSGMTASRYSYVYGYYGNGDA